MSTPNSTNIFRCPHDEENPYFLLNRNNARNKDLSWKARGFLHYLLSFEKSWAFSLPWIARHQNTTEEMVNKMFKELMVAGYAHREIYRDEKGYKRWRIFISEFPKFQKIFPNPCFPGQGFPDQENPGTKNKQENPYQDSQEEDITRLKKRPAQAPPSADAEELCNLLLQKIEEHKEGFKVQSWKNWLKEMDLLLKSLSKERIQEIIIYLPSNTFYKHVVLSPGNLRKNFHQIAGAKQREEEEHKISTNKAFAYAAKKEFREAFKYMEIGGKGATNLHNQKDAPFSLPINLFRDLLFRNFGETYGGPYVQ